MLGWLWVLWCYLFQIVVSCHIQQDYLSNVPLDIKYGGMNESSQVCCCYLHSSYYYLVVSFLFSSLNTVAHVIMVSCCSLLLSNLSRYKQPKAVLHVNLSGIFFPRYEIMSLCYSHWPFGVLNSSCRKLVNTRMMKSATLSQNRVWVTLFWARKDFTLQADAVMTRLIQMGLWSVKCLYTRNVPVRCYGQNKILSCLILVAMHIDWEKKSASRDERRWIISDNEMKN
jgi:hypothetical protein